MEEIGKAEIVKMAAAREDFDSVSEASTWAANRADDHQEKLFWALWGPAFGRERITGAQVAREQETARALHDARKAASYVSLMEGASPPRSTVTESQVKRMVRLAEARLGLLGRPRFLKPTPDVAGRARWFTDLTESPEGRARAMSNASMVKLAELGDAAAWMDWLREQEAAALEASASLLEEERARSSSAGQPKWRVKARLVSPGVSIRPKALARWNNGVDHIKLAAGSKGRVLGIETTLLDDVHIDSLASVLTGVLTRLMLAFNIGTLSLFVWEESRFQGAFCDSIHDIENDAELHAVPLSPGPVDWGRHALSETDMQDVMLAMAVMPFPGDKEFEPFERYRRAIVMLGKADVHMNLVPAAVEELRASMASALVTLGGWDGSGALRGALEAHVGDVLGSFEEDDRALVTDQASSSIVEIEKALRVKVILDALLIRFLRARAVERKAAESARTSSRRTREPQGGRP